MDVQARKQNHDAHAEHGLEPWLLQLFLPDEAHPEVERVEAVTARLTRQYLTAQTTGSSETVRAIVSRLNAPVLPEEPTSIGQYLEAIGDSIIADSTNTASPRFIGHMTTALPYFTRPLSRLITALNQNVVKMETAKALIPLERQVLAMLHHLIYSQPERFYQEHSQNERSTVGVVTSGGTIANITALWCARNLALGPTQDFAGVEREGLIGALEAHGYRGAAVIGSAQMHYSFEKALDLLGLGLRNLIKVPVDERGRVDPDAVRQSVEKCRQRNLLVLAIIGVAGTTDSGAIDPLGDLADLAAETGTHFHVDAAWGGPTLFSHRYGNKLAGIERADSVTIDGHKQLYLPMGIGMLMLRDPNLASAIEKRARYIIRPGSMDLGRRALEGSRPAMSLLLHAALHIIGRRGYEQLIDEGIRKAQYMAQEIRSRPDFELIMEPELNILNYRYIPPSLQSAAARGALSEDENRFLNHLNEQLQKTQRNKAQSFISRTALKFSRYPQVELVRVLRAVIANPLTTEQNLEDVLDEQSEIGRKLAEQASTHATPT